MSSDMYGTWFSRIEFMGGEEDGERGSITLAVPTLQHKDYLVKNWKPRIIEELKKLSGKNLTVEFLVPAANWQRGVDAPTESKPKELKPKETIDEKAQRCGLHPGLVFETFVTGKANRVARSSAEIVSQKPGTQCNPFFIFGGVGLGKTHLMHAIGRRLLETNPKIKLLCLSADTFTKEVVSLSSGGHVSDEKIKQFDDKYRKLDALLIDDVQLLSKRGGSQSYLFGVLEALLPANKQVIFTCDQYARELAEFDERLISRMSKGLSVAIEPAEFELRAAIVMSKAKLQHVDLPEEVAYLIATKMNTNIRELEGALNTVLVNAKVMNQPVSVELAKKALKSLSSPGVISIESIQKATSEHFKIGIADMYSPSRKADIVRARSIAIYLAKELTQKSLVDIGAAFGGRNHSTVLHAVTKISQERSTNPELNHTLHLIEQSLKNWA